MSNCNITNYKPAVPKTTLLMLSGLMWFIAGLLLNRYAIGWLDEYSENTAILYAIIGFIMAMLIHHFGFLRLVDKNLRRIDAMQQRPCVFAFVSWRSIILIIVMVGIGISLRETDIPRHILASIYSGIGIALMLSSIRYFRRVKKILRPR